MLVGLGKNDEYRCAKRPRCIFPPHWTLSQPPSPRSNNKVRDILPNPPRVSSSTLLVTNSTASTRKLTIAPGAWSRQKRLLIRSIRDRSSGMPNEGSADSSSASAMTTTLGTPATYRSSAVKNIRGTESDGWEILVSVRVPMRGNPFLYMELEQHPNILDTL